MLQLQCPFCGLRDESEFSFGGEAHIARPLEPDALNDEEWADYLFNRSNVKGFHREMWLHAAGCRQWFYAIRNTVSYEFTAFYRVGDPLPDLPNRSVPGAAK
jgi:sarcosine oxidase subunit delta